MGVRFDDPIWLLLLVLAIPLAFAGLRWMRAMSRLRAWTAIAARAGVIAIIASMLAGASSVRRVDRMAVIVVVDVSGSVRRFAPTEDAGGRAVGVIERARAWIAGAQLSMGADDLLGVGAYDAGAIAVAAPRVGGWDVADIPLDVTAGEGSDLARAIELAGALLPPDAAGRIVVISDGVQTAGDGARAAAGVRAPIDVVPIAYSVAGETLVEFVDAPPTAARDSTVTVRIGLRAATPTRGVLYLRREGEIIDIDPDAAGLGRRITLDEGLNVELAQVELDDRPIHRFEAIFEPDENAPDAVAQNNRAEAFTVAPGAGSVLVVDGVSDGAPDGAGRRLADTLADAGLSVETIAPLAAPTDLLSLQAYDLVILENVAADELPRPTQALLPDYVGELGGGLLMTGGPDAFGPGGWKGSPIEEILPVRLDIPEELVVPSAAIMIVLDSSGSMGRTVLGGSRSQQEIANDAAAIAIRTLDARDLIGVIEFSESWSEVVPLSPNTNPDRSADRVLGISPGGGTNLYPALVRAGSLIKQVEAQVKHVIVLSDGQSEGDASSGVATATDLVRSGVSVTTIAVGDGADVETLRAIADAGGGAFHQVTNPYLLPRIFIREVRVLRNPLVREATIPARILPTGSALTQGLPRPVPALAGMVLTQACSEPGLVNAIAAPSGEPLLAHWNVGVGRVGAWTSDAHRWAANWLDWPGYRVFWTQAARSLARPSAGRAFDLTSDIEGDTLRLRVEAVDEEGEPVDLLTIPGVVYTPSGERREVRLAQVGPGLYETELDAPDSGAYVAALTPRRAGQTLTPVIGGVSKATSPEYRRLRSDVAALQAIAAGSGGQVLDLTAPAEARLFERGRMDPVRAESPLWRTLLLWLLAVLLLDIATRRIAWDRFFGPEFAAELRRLGEEERRLAAAGAGRLDALRKRSEGVRDRFAGAQPTRAGRPVRRARRPVEAEEPAPEPPKPDAEESAGGLLAAKRRANERFQAPRRGEEPGDDTRAG
ncbi:MAG: VWA domain-containing protein [Phycisphaerales bacterium]